MEKLASQQEQCYQDVDDAGNTCYDLKDLVHRKVASR